MLKGATEVLFGIPDEIGPFLDSCANSFRKHPSRSSHDPSKMAIRYQTSRSPKSGARRISRFEKRRILANSHFRELGSKHADCLISGFVLWIMRSRGIGVLKNEELSFSASAE